MANVEVILKACRLGDLSALESHLTSRPDLINATDSKLGWNGLYCSVMCGHSYIAKYLLQQGANANIKNRIGETPLHQAVDCKNLKMVKLLIAYSADPNSQQNDGDTPLHLAVRRSALKIVTYLLLNNADPNICNFVYGKSPVHYAVESGNMKIYLELCKYKGDNEVKDKSGRSPEEILQDFSSKPARMSPELSELTSLTQQTSPNYTRCNSDIYFMSEQRSIESKIKQIGLLHKKIRETVRTSVETFKRLDYSSSMIQDCDSEKTTSESRLPIEVKPELYKCLKTLRMLSEYETLVAAGYDDLPQLIRQMKSGIPLTEKNLLRIGIKKPAHRRKLLAALDQLGNGEEAEGIFQQLKCCLVLPTSIWSNSVVGVEKWLEDMSLGELAGNFRAAGFEELEDIIAVSLSKWPIDEMLLIEMGIDKPGHRHRILSNIKDVVHNRKHGDIVIDRSSSNSACTSCNII